MNNMLAISEAQRVDQSRHDVVRHDRAQSAEPFVGELVRQGAKLTKLGPKTAASATRLGLESREAANRTSQRRVVITTVTLADQPILEGRRERAHRQHGAYLPREVQAYRQILAM